MTPPTDDLGRARVGELLVQRGIITAAQLNEALEQQHATGALIGAIVVEKGWVTEEQVAKTLSEQLGLAFVDLGSRPVEPEAYALVPPELCRSSQAVPLFTMGNSLTVAMVNPLDTGAIAELQRVSQRHIRPVFATPSAVRKFLEQDHPAEPRHTEGGRAEHGEPVASLKAGASMAPVIQLIDTLMTEAITAAASDIHLEPTESEYLCRFRIDGLLHDRPALPKDYQAAAISRIKIMSNMDIAEKRLPQDGRIQMAVNGRAVDMRVSTFPTVHGENVVIRVLDKQRVLLNLDDMGFSPGVLVQFQKLILRPYGIVLVTGPTGSGKTTTLYAALNQINTADKNIMTLEDPVECELPRIRQSQVNVKAGLTFATGLRSMLRQDPDVILIGEIRDRETADIAIHASLTGHLVFSTLHTNDAASAATRLVDMGVEPFLVSTSMIGILAQRLVRTLCATCKTPYQPPPEVLDRLGVGRDQPVTIFQEVGCPRCRQTGHQGRIGIYELLMPNDQIRQSITQQVPSGVIKEQAIRNGLVTLWKDGVEKVTRGVTSIAEVMRVTEEV